MSKKSQEDTLASLQELGINVLLDHAVKDFQDDIVTFANGKTIETDTLTFYGWWSICFH